jgi:hypothetical protein
MSKSALHQGKNLANSYVRENGEAGADDGRSMNASTSTMNRAYLAAAPMIHAREST